MFRGFLIFAVALVLVTLVYRRAPINFLRAESGWYLSTSHSDAGTQQQMQRDFFGRSWGGHYTPLAFWTEFQFAKAVGANGSVWRGRQIVAVAAVAAGVFGLVCAAGGILALPSGPRRMLAAAASAGLAFQPEMLDFIGWPFMIMQLLWMGLGCVAVYALVRLSASADKGRWAWVAALSAYASMHVSGLGVVLVVAVACVLGCVILSAVRSRWREFQPHVRVSAAALLTMLGLAAVHGWAMVHFAAEEPAAPSIQQQLSPTLPKLLAGFLGQFALAGIKSFIATGAAQLNGRTIAYTWPFGLLLIGSVIALLVWLLRRTYSQPAPHRMAEFVLHVFDDRISDTRIALCAPSVSDDSAERHGRPAGVLHVGCHAT